MKIMPKREGTPAVIRDDMPEHLLFKPQPVTIIEPIIECRCPPPRYLFRVATPKSAGMTNSKWVLSASAVRNTSSSKEDIFYNLDKEKQKVIAKALNAHLRWQVPKHESEFSHFVSWTSSLLFAIQYIYYRHIHWRDRSVLDDIKLYAIDTTTLPPGTFFSSQDLIQFFSASEPALEPLKALRLRKDFFACEYLSQGSLRIEGKCAIIPASSLFKDNRLYRLQPQFSKLEYFYENQGHLKNRTPLLVNEVIRLRNILWLDPTCFFWSGAFSTQLEAAREIIQSISQPSWRFPLAVYITALIGHEAIETEKTREETYSMLWAYMPVEPPSRFPDFFSSSSMDRVPEHFQFVEGLLKFDRLKAWLGEIEMAEDRLSDLIEVHENDYHSSYGDPYSVNDDTVDRIHSSLSTIQALCEDMRWLLPSYNLN